MVAVSDKWKQMQSKTLTDEAFVEVSCGVTEVGAQDDAVPSETDGVYYSDVSVVASTASNVHTPEATLEHNLWVLDGTRYPIPALETYEGSGYTGTGTVTLSFPAPRTVLIPGIIITWSKTFDEYAVSFTVTAKNGEDTIAETTVSGNGSVESVVDLEMQNYDSITVTVHTWSIPGHRYRIENVFIGHVLTFRKTDLLSYEHSSSGDLFSGALPKNAISFSLDNLDGRWNPTNPEGTAQYLSERQNVSVRYGFKLDDGIEWINGGTFYLYEWAAPSNGVEATFSARDIFEFLIDKTYKKKTGQMTLYAIAEDAISQADAGVTYQISDTLKNYTAQVADNYTIAEILQHCANAAGCVMYQSRDGVLHIAERSKARSDYHIGLAVSWSYPEVTLSKPLRSIIVNYANDGEYTLNVGSVGEDQTVTNDFITTAEQAAAVAGVVGEELKTRETVSGNFRADPRLDVFDIISVDSKHGTVVTVVTDVKYTFSGAFHGTFTGRMTTAYDTSSELGSFVLGTSTLGG